MAQRARLPITPAAILEHLLGAPPGFEVEVETTTYVLPLGADPYWMDFGTCWGWELLPEDEHPVRVGPSRDIWPPGTPRPGFREGNRRTWVQRPAPAEIADPVLPWDVLGDLRRCIRWLKEDRDLLMPGRANMATCGTYLLKLLGGAEELRQSIDRSQRHWPTDWSASPASPIFDSLAQVSEALARLAEASVDVADEAAIAARRNRYMLQLSTAGASGPLPPAYDRTPRRRHPDALLVVHAAMHYFRDCHAELTPTSLAMIVALEPSANFGQGSRYLDGTGQARKAAIGYWRDRIRDYAMPTTRDSQGPVDA